MKEGGERGEDVHCVRPLWSTTRETDKDKTERERMKETLRMDFPP